MYQNNGDEEKEIFSNVELFSEFSIDGSARAFKSLVLLKKMPTTQFKKAKHIWPEFMESLATVNRGKVSWYSVRRSTGLLSVKINRKFWFSEFYKADKHTSSTTTGTPPIDHKAMHTFEKEIKFNNSFANSPYIKDSSLFLQIKWVVRLWTFSINGAQFSQVDSCSCVKKTSKIDRYFHLLKIWQKEPCHQLKYFLIINNNWLPTPL